MPLTMLFSDEHYDVCLFQPYILPTIQGKHQDLKSISTETVSCAGTFLSVLSPSPKPVWCCCFCLFFYTASLNQFVGGHWCFWVCVCFYTAFPNQSGGGVFGVCFYTAPPNQSGGVFKKILFTLLPQTSPVVVVFCFLHCSPKPVWWWCFWCVCFYTAPPNQSGGGVFGVCVFYTAPPNQSGGVFFVCLFVYTALPNQSGGGGVLH